MHFFWHFMLSQLETQVCNLPFLSSHSVLFCFISLLSTPTSMLRCHLYFRSAGNLAGLLLGIFYIFTSGIKHSSSPQSGVSFYSATFWCLMWGLGAAVAGHCWGWHKHWRGVIYGWWANPLGQVQPSYQWLSCEELTHWVIFLTVSQVIIKWRVSSIQLGFVSPVLNMSFVWTIHGYFPFYSSIWMEWQ